MNRHLQSTSNPHKVTAAQVGLDKVKNVSTDDQTPTYTEASTLTRLTSGEKLSVAFGKISRAITDLISHVSNRSNPHKVTASQAGARAEDWLPTIADIGAAPSGYGLGNYGTWISDLNLADKCGYYSWTATAQNIPFAYGNMFVIRRSDGRITQVGIDPYMEGHGGIVVRHYTTSQWTPWEWINPPMNFGVEYCTTDRVGSARVYVKRISAGNLANKGTIKCSLPSGISVVGLTGYALSSSGGYYPLPLLSFSSGAVRSMMRKVNNDIEIVTFDDCSAYTAYVTVKYTKA